MLEASNLCHGLCYSSHRIATQLIYVFDVYLFVPFSHVDLNLKGAGPFFSREDITVLATAMFQ